MTLTQGISIHKKANVRKEYILGNGTRLVAATSYERQSEGHRIQTEVCIGTVSGIGPEVKGLEVGEVVLLIYASLEMELPDGTYWYSANSILGTIKNGVIKGYGPKICGYTLSNQQAISLGIMEPPKIAMPDTWNEARFTHKNQTHLFKTYGDNTVHWAKRGLVGQQVVDWEEYGIEGLPRTVYFVDKEDVVHEFESPVELNQEDANKYNSLTLRSNVS